MTIFTKNRTLAKPLVLVLMFLTVCVTAYAQPASISGRITDANGELLGGATIMEKGTSNGAISDATGYYNLSLTTSNPVLVVTFLGFETTEVAVVSSRVVDVALNPNVSALDELVVVGYGTQRRVSVVGAQSVTTGADIRVPAPNISNAISGRLAGVVQVSRGNEPGREENNIWIRGISNFTGQDSSPLVLVDGVERSMNQLDFEDIDTFTVLKDASATAVYGVRGANGVILVTTKPGRVGKPKFSFDYYESFTRMTKVPDMADAYTYMNVANEAYSNANPGKRALYTPEYIIATKKAHGILPNDNPRMYNQYLYPAVDWMKEMFNNWGHNRHANVNVRGGVPNANYYVSLSYYDETGLTKNFELEKYNTKMQYNRYNFTSNLNLKPTSKTRVDLGFSGYLATGHYPQQSASTLYSAATEINPVELPMTMPDGSLSGKQANGGLRNPYMDLAQRGFYQEFSNTINSNIRVTQQLDWWDWSEGLSATAMIAFDAYNTRKMSYNRWSDMFWYGTPNPDDGLGPNGLDGETGLWSENAMFNTDGDYRMYRVRQGSDALEFAQESGSNRTTYVEASLNYDRNFGKHRVSGLFLYNHRIYRDLSAGDLSGSLAYKSRGYAGRLTYSYDDRYLFEANVGINGSENFTPDKRFGTFPAFGVGWVISNESFFEPVSSVISYLKLRYTLGYVGSDAVTDRRFMYQGIMSGSTDDGIYGVRQDPDFNLTPGWGIKNYGVDVGWSRSRKQDIGIDINMFENRLSLTVDLFQEHRDRIFIHRQLLPDYAGFVEAPWANLGIVDNRGIETQIEYRHDFNKDISLTFRGNFTYNKSEIIEDDSPVARYPWLETRGTALNARWGYTALGLFTSQEEIDSYGVKQWGELHPGDIKYLDRNGDGEITTDDQSVIGIGDVPRIYYGFGFDLQIRRWSVGALFQGVAQADRHLSGRSIHPFSGSTGLDNLYANIGDRWSKDDPTNTDVFYPRLTYMQAANINNTQTSTWWQKDVGFLRLKQLNVSYMLPQRWMDKCFLDNASIYLMGTNLLTFSKFKLWDPELNTDNGTAYPNTSSFSIGLKFSF
jgi:TonB-linked SusC/RagA family outer membrane protein